MTPPARLYLLLCVSLEFKPTSPHAPADHRGTVGALIHLQGTDGTSRLHRHLLWSALNSQWCMCVFVCVCGSVFVVVCVIGGARGGDTVTKHSVKVLACHITRISLARWPAFWSESDTVIINVVLA